MDKRRSINTKFWEDSWIESLSIEEKLLFIYLLTSPLTTLLGIYEITLKRISYDTGISQEKILKHLKAFEKIRKALFFENYIILFNFLKNQSFNPNMKKGAIDLYNSLPNSIKTKLLEYGFESFESLSNPLQSIREEEREEEIEKEKEGEIINTPLQINKLFYRDQFKNSDENYKEFLNILKTAGTNDGELEKVLNMKPLSFTDFSKLYTKYPNIELWKFTLISLNYYKKSYKELYPTLVNWLSNNITKVSKKSILIPTNI